MKTERQFLIQGALAAFKSGDKYNPDLEQAGVTEETWDLLTQTEMWRGADVDIARRALDGTICAAFAVAGIPRVSVSAEYLATCIACVVKPSNWQVAAYIAGAYLDGVKLVASNGDEIAAREHISGERLHNLVLLAATMRDQALPARERESDFMAAAE